MPCLERAYAAIRQYCTLLEYATRVTWVPSLMTFAFPKGIVKLGSITSSLTSYVSLYKF